MRYECQQIPVSLEYKHALLVAFAYHKSFIYTGKRLQLGKA